jgi:hypothetical protein
LNCDDKYRYNIKFLRNMQEGAPMKFLTIAASLVLMLAAAGNANAALVSNAQPRIREQA